MRKSPVQRRVSILGCRGIPAQHGGFETFAEHLSRHLVERDWNVTVYCQENGPNRISEHEWHGVRLVRIAVPGDSARSTVAFDWHCTLHAVRESSLKLVLGYNTALFSVLYRLRGRFCLMNMDGIEWRRQKWGPFARTWLYLNEGLGCRLSNLLIADNPGIADHLGRRVARSKIRMIPYGAEAPTAVDPALLARFGVEPHRFALVIARPEPENSLLEIVRAFSAPEIDCKLLVLGNLTPAASRYHRSVLAAAGGKVLFPGAIYDQQALATLRSCALFYVHGHTVGGTNPSLVEALAAGLPVVASDNPFNRWVAAGAARYFSDESSLQQSVGEIVGDPRLRLDLSLAARKRHAEAFTWDAVCRSYEELFNWCLEPRCGMRAEPLERDQA